MAVKFYPELAKGSFVWLDLYLDKWIVFGSPVRSGF
jgi:hypothetical protein